MNLCGCVRGAWQGLLLQQRYHGSDSGLGLGMALGWLVKIEGVYNDMAFLTSCEGHDCAISMSQSRLTGQPMFFVPLTSLVAWGRVGIPECELLSTDG